MIRAKFLVSPTGCTVGVVHLPGGRLFFKNRNLSGKYLANRTTVWQSTPDLHALEGVNLQTGELEGVAIGVNRHRVRVANTHVVSTFDVTYDISCEQLLLDAREEPDAPHIVSTFMDQHAVQGGRILVSGPEWSFLVEVMGRRFEVQAIQGSFVITNSFSLIPYQEKSTDGRQQSSASRLRVAGGMLPNITHIGALESMLRSHLPTKGELSICNHRQDGGGTESSHIIQIRGDYVGWPSLTGFPLPLQLRCLWPYYKKASFNSFSRKKNRNRCTSKN